MLVGAAADAEEDRRTDDGVMTIRAALELGRPPDGTIEGAETATLALLRGGEAMALVAALNRVADGSDLTELASEEDC